MTKFTKEQLIEQAQENVKSLKMAAVQNAFKDIRPAIELDLHLAEIALAALTDGMEQEPVGEVVLGDYDDCGDYPDAKVVCVAAQGQADWNNFRNGTRLYAEPRLPQSTVDQKAVESLATDLMKRIDKITGERHSVATLSSLRVSIVEACRAAMLQGAEPVQGWIPCSERMPLLASPQQEVKTDNTTQQFESLGLIVTSDEWKMELPRCSKHPETELQVHPFEQLLSYPPRPVMYCPECEPWIDERIKLDKQIRRARETN